MSTPPVYSPISYSRSPPSSPRIDYYDSEETESDVPIPITPVPPPKKKKKTINKKRKNVVVEVSLPEGWTFEERFRNGGTGSGYKYYYDPARKYRFRSRVAVDAYVKYGTLTKEYRSKAKLSRLARFSRSY